MQIDGDLEDEECIGQATRHLGLRDLKRLEEISLPTRLVGQMMQERGGDLFGKKREAPRRFFNFDLIYYSNMCKKQNLRTVVVGKSGIQEKHKQASSKKEKIKAKLNEERYINDCELVRSLRKSFPQFDKFVSHWEAYFVAFRVWVKQPPINCDKIISLKNLLLILKDEDLDASVISDLTCDMENMLAGITFVELLDRMIINESIYEAPSFIRGWAPLQPYPEQLEVMRALYQALNPEAFGQQKKHVIRFCTPPSTGKSSAAALLGTVFMRHAQTRKKVRGRTRNYMCYICYQECVRYDVAKTCIAANLPLAILSHKAAYVTQACFHGKYRMMPPYIDTKVSPVEHCLKYLDTCDIPPNILITDLETGGEFLAHVVSDNNYEDIVLLFDEPFAKIDGDKQIHQNTYVMRNLPRISVLMSATLPSFPEIEAKIGSSSETHAFQNVQSQRIASPCTIVDGHRNVYAPHRLYTSSIPELRRFLIQNPYQTRLYSPRATSQLISDCRQNGVESVDKFLEEVPALKASSLESIREVALSILGLFTDDSRILQGAVSDTVENYVLPCLSTMATVSSHYFIGTTMIISEEAEVAKDSILEPLLYDAEKLSKRMKLASRVKKYHSEASEKVSQIEKMRIHGEDQALTINAQIWSPETCINTIAHAQKFKNPIHPQQAKHVPYVQEDVLETSNCDLVEALLCGYCCIQSRLADNVYSLAATTMAEKPGTFTFLNGNKDIIYGVNLPCDCVLLNFPEGILSKEAFLQCLGRVGRTGKYSRSEIMFSSRSLLKDFVGQILA